MGMRNDVQEKAAPNLYETGKLFRTGINQLYRLNVSHSRSNWTKAGISRPAFFSVSFISPTVPKTENRTVFRGRFCVYVFDRFDLRT